MASKDCGRDIVTPEMRELCEAAVAYAGEDGIRSNSAPLRLHHATVAYRATLKPKEPEKPTGEHLFVTPLHERALAVAEAYHRASVAFDPKGSIPRAACIALNALEDIGCDLSRRDTLRKPEEPRRRFLAMQPLNLDGTPRAPWHVTDLGPPDWTPSIASLPRSGIGPFSKAEAIAVQDALNALDRDEAGK